MSDDFNCFEDVESVRSALISTTSCCRLTFAQLQSFASKSHSGGESDVNENFVVGFASVGAYFAGGLQQAIEAMPGENIHLTRVYDENALLRDREGSSFSIS